MPFFSTSPERAPESVSELLQQRATQRPDQPAYVFLSDVLAADGGESIGAEITWTYADLDRRARAVAAIVSRQAAPGDRAVLLFPPGLDFVAAYFGCLYAGVLPVPATYPKPRRASTRLDSIVADCAPRLALTTADTLASLRLGEQTPAVRDLAWIAADQCVDAPNYQPIERSASDPAFLQYTSGSTSEPRGVVVTHGNLLHNMELIRAGFDIAVAEDGTAPNGVFWLPAYHDMGLIGGILTPLYVGGTTYLIAPAAFLQRPLVWLETISRTRAAYSGAPNFAYELCTRKAEPADIARLDLSSWRVAFCGAEPIDPNVLEEFDQAFAPAGFRTKALYPCYGLAEATLMVTGGAAAGKPIVVHADRAQLAVHKLVDAGPTAPGSQQLVSCGRPLGDQEILIVDPKTREPLPPGAIGEIWIRGASIAKGYWNHPDELSQTFNAHLAIGRGPFLRTGDLGAFHSGELFVTGRLKDVIIIRGRNLYPQDIERTAQQAHEAVESGAAFSVGEPGHEELVVVHQVGREHRRGDMAPVIRAIRAAIVEEHEVDPQTIVLLRPATLPFTSSGKVQRSRCRELFQSDGLEVLERWTRPAETAAPLGTVNGVPAGSPPRPKFLDHVASYTVDSLAVEIQTWMLAWLADKVEQVGEGPLSPESTFAVLGIDSLTAIELNLEFEKLLGVRMPPAAAWSYPTPAALSHFIAETMLNVATMGVGPDGNPADSWFAAMDADAKR